MKYFNRKVMKPFFELLDKCKGIEQKEEYHPEGDVLTHSLQVFHYACRETNDIDLLLASLLHDVGKAVNTLEHTHEALNLLDEYVSTKTIWLIKNHMRVWTYLHGEMRGLKKCKDLADHPWFSELVQLARFDNIGRIRNYQPTYNKQEIIDRLNKAIEEHWKYGIDPYHSKREKENEIKDRLKETELDNLRIKREVRND
jgi:predicted HD phosphohydrolase